MTLVPQQCWTRISGSELIFTSHTKRVSFVLYVAVSGRRGTTEDVSHVIKMHGAILVSRATGT